MNTTSYWNDTVGLRRFRKRKAGFGADILIIGGGITRITAAYLFKKSGQVIETQDEQACIGETAGRHFAATDFGGDGMTLGILGSMMALDAFRRRKNRRKKSGRSQIN